MSDTPAGPSTATVRKGVWEPLPLIVYGYAVHPLSASRRETHISRRRLSTVTEASNDEHMANKDVVSLEVGDEVYAFEKYTPQGKEVEGIWYRGCVIRIFYLVEVPTRAQSPHADTSYAQPADHQSHGPHLLIHLPPKPPRKQRSLNKFSSAYFLPPTSMSEMSCLMRKVDSRM